MPGIITLLSDFGSTSPYPAQMKAVLASSCSAVLLDITHDVPRHDIRTGAYLLSTVARATPAGTVHLAVVDPGVGTARKPLIVVSGGQFFVGPDNGVLMPAAMRLGPPHAYEITSAQILRRAVSATFHGRDLFAPTAARLVQGTPPEALGQTTDHVVELTLGTGRRVGNTVRGEVLYVDAFGNLITNIAAEQGEGWPAAVKLTVGRRRTRTVLANTYGSVTRGDTIVVPGSDGLLEVAVREGSAATQFAAGPGARVRIVWKTSPRR